MGDCVFGCVVFDMLFVVFGYDILFVYVKCGVVCIVLDMLLVFVVECVLGYMVLL